MAFRMKLKRIYYSNPVLFEPLRKIYIYLVSKVNNTRGEFISVSRIKSILSEAPVIKLPEFNGSFSVSAESDLFLRVLINGHYEPELSALVKKHMPNKKDIVDVGANVGFYSVLSAKINNSNRVLSIEPHPEACKHLRANVNRNGINGQVIIFQGAASDVEGSFKLTYFPGREEYSTLGIVVHPSVSGLKEEQIEISAKTLDQLVEKYSLDVGLIKIDVEGTEFNVLKGALNTIKKYRPIILCELVDSMLNVNGSSTREVIELLEELGYYIIDPMSPDLRPGTRKFGEIMCFPDRILNS